MIAHSHFVNSIFLIRKSLLKNKVMSINTTTVGVVESLLKSKIENEYSPTFVLIENESYKHNVPKGSESHFKVLIVSNLFEGKKLIERHRMINKTLSEELKTSIHALSIHAKTPLEYSQLSQDNIPKTPNCMGGNK